ncbi:LysR family transcriptional regulator [Enterobacteriaceae bacterium 89]|nr:LysR family transcriptional regulator [Enterobacteriaceae bacterium 89]
MHTEIDLKLLKIINTLVVNGSVTKTAELLNLSPGTISYALKKARTLTGAHLFIRTKSGMKPDTTARELSQRYQRFNETNSSKTFITDSQPQDEITVMTYSPVEMMIAKAVKQLATDKQHYRYTFLPYDSEPSLRLEKLKNGQVDLDIGSKLPADPLINKVKLFSCPVSVLANRNAGYDEQLSLEQWQSCKHAVWSVFIDYYSDSIKTSQQAIKHINERNVAMISGSIINMVAFCATSDCIMIIPDYFVSTLTEAFQVKSLKIPSGMEINYDCYLHFTNSMTENRDLLDVVSDITSCLQQREIFA